MLWLKSIFYYYIHHIILQCFIYHIFNSQNDKMRRYAFICLIRFTLDMTKQCDTCMRYRNFKKPLRNAQNSKLHPRKKININMCL